MNDRMPESDEGIIEPAASEELDPAVDQQDAPLTPEERKRPDSGGMSREEALGTFRSKRSSEVDSTQGDSEQETRNAIYDMDTEEDKQNMADDQITQDAED